MSAAPVPPSSRALFTQDRGWREFGSALVTGAPKLPLPQAAQLYNVLVVGLDACNWHREEGEAESRQEILDAVFEAAQTLRMLGVDVRVRTRLSVELDQTALDWAHALVIVREAPDSPAYFSAMELAMSVSQNVVVFDAQVAERTALTMKDQRRIDVLNQVDATTLAMCWLETGTGGTASTASTVSSATGSTTGRRFQRR